MKWNSLLRLFQISPWVMITLFLIISLEGCRSAPKSPKSGIPQNVRIGSFKVTMDSEGGSPAELQQLLRSHAQEIAKSEGCAVETVEPIAWEEGAITSDLIASYHVLFGNCKLGDEKLRQVLNSFEAKESVFTIEADAIVNVSVVENDPYKGRQYHLNRINREAACNSLGGRRGQEVVVAVIDSGVDRDHPDLIGSFFRNSSGAVVGANFVGKGARAQPDSNWDDINGHGTHVAGLVAASANNGQGIVGVGSCANVKIMPIRVMNDNGAGNMVEIDRGVQWAIAQGADVINMSLGGSVYFNEKRASHPSPLYADAAARGVIVFAAAGNESARLGSRAIYGYVYSYPASYDGVVSVAATDGSDRVVEFSNRGDTVDIAAPGYDDLSTVMGGGYGLMSGTSMASPVAAGAYALALSAVRQSRQERVPGRKALPAIMKAVRSQSMARSEVGSGGVLDSLALVNLLKLEVSPTRQEPLPENKPAEPFPNQPTAVALRFEGLSDNQLIQSSSKFSVGGWPKGQTVAIYLYWRPAQGGAGFTFAILTADNLSSDGRKVTTNQAYYLMGAGTLVAESIDTRGQRNGLASIKLRGI